MIRMDAALYVSLSVTQYIFSFQKGHLMCDESCAIIPPLSLEYYEAKIQMLSVFTWKPALEMAQYVEIQIFLFLKARSKK